MNTSTPSLSIVLPIFSEALNIEAIIADIQKNLTPLDIDYEIIFVDDGSTDNSWEVLQQSAAKHPELQAIRFSRNFGKEHALFAGIEAARGSAVITLDGDQQHPPEIIPLMIQIWQSQDVDVIDVVKKERRSDPLFQRLSANLFYYTFSKLSGININNSTDYKLLNRKVVDAMLQFRETGFFYRGIVNWIGFKHISISIDVPTRKHGATKWSYSKLVPYAFNNIFNYTSKPLVLIGLFGILFMVSAVVLFLISIIRLITGTTLAGFSTVIILELFIGGIMVTSMSLIGVYLAKIYNEIKGRPKYIVTEKLHKE
jgi:glycosyltransferase involved in cell wall biosynthesis